MNVKLSNIEKNTWGMTRLNLLGTFALFAGMAWMPTPIAAADPAVRISVTNPTEDDWDNVPVVMPITSETAYATARSDDGKWIFIQNDDLDGDGKPDEMVFPASLKAGETKEYSLSQTAPRMAIHPTAHTGMYTKTAERRGFEGPGWESDMIAYRIYWDARNATDVFAKTTPTLSMENLARSAVDYHHHTPWGMDVLKVKTAVGIGGFGALIDGKVEKVSTATRSFIVRADGPYRAVCDLKYTDWKVAGRTLELVARMKICGGQDYVDCDLMVKANDGKPLPQLLCGFVKHVEETTLIKDDKVAMVGRWGNQALGEGEKPMGGNLGMALMADADQGTSISEDEVNHLIVFKPETNVSYRYFVDWYLDPEPAHSPAEFEKMMRQRARKHPIAKFM